jgi:predicted nucleic acid-binding protein
MIIVADSGPIISFARAGRLDLLKQVTTELIIPDAVFEEIVVSGGDRAGAEEVKQDYGSSGRRFRIVLF